jgi:23S rRNA (cytosine1962-C5)-methyltransferase
MNEDKFIMFSNRLTKVYRHLNKQAKKQQVSCYRVYDHDLPEFPFCIEIYADKLYIAEYKRHHGMADGAHDIWLEKSLLIAAEILNIPKENIFLKLRQRKPGRLGQYQKYDASQHEFTVEEGARQDDPRLIDSVGQAVGRGLKFIINLSDYLDTGLFLDHRLTRQMVSEKSKGKKVLNLFAYTGSFSVYAAAGGAEEVVTVDLSKTYLNWSQRNMQLNGFTTDNLNKHIHADVKQYLKELPAGYFDIVVMDPPTFSNSKRMEDILDIQRDHAELINGCLRCMKNKGLLYFSTNSRKFILEKEKINTTAIKDITKATTPFDFEGKLFRQCFVIEK